MEGTGAVVRYLQDAGVARLVLQDLVADPYGAQHVAQIVGQTAGQVPDGLELLGLE